MKRRLNNVYYMNGFGSKNDKVTKSINIIVNSKKSFRCFKKGGFYTTKNTFKVVTMPKNNNYLVKVDGSCFEPNTYHKSLFKRLGRYYPIF